MAKSLRSKSKLKAKSIKRGKEFQNAVDARQERLHAKAKEDLLKQKAEELKDKEAAAEESMIDDEPKEEKKISTSGYRTARHHLYKKVHQKNKKNHTSFKKK